LQKKRDIEQELADKKKDPRVEAAGSHQEEAKEKRNEAKAEEDEDERTQESGEESMEKRPSPESSD
jgi:hypothetical protein